MTTTKTVVGENGVISQCNIIHFELPGYKIKRSLNLYQYCTAYCIVQKWMRKSNNNNRNCEILIYDFPIDLMEELRSGRITKSRTHDNVKSYPLVWCVSQEIDNVNDDTFCLLGRNTGDSKLIIHYTLYEIKDNGYFLSNFQLTPLEIIMATLTSQYSIPFDNFEFEALFHNVEQPLITKISQCLYGDNNELNHEEDENENNDAHVDPTILFCKQCKGFYEEGKPKNCDCYCDYEN